MDFLLAQGADLNDKPYNMTALIGAAHGGSQIVVQWLLDRDAHVDGTWNMPTGRTALHMAALQGRLDFVRTLVEHGADPTRKDDEFDSTPAGYAAWSGAQDVIDYLEGRD